MNMKAIREAYIKGLTGFPAYTDDAVDKSADEFMDEVKQSGMVGNVPITDEKQRLLAKAEGIEEAVGKLKPGAPNPPDDPHPEAEIVWNVLASFMDIANELRKQAEELDG